MSTSVSLATIPSSVVIAGTPISPVILAIQSNQVVNWSALGASVAAVLLTMWGREKDWSLMRRAASFVGAIFGGWSIPLVVMHNLPDKWLQYIPLDFPQTWAIAGSLFGIISAQFFITLIWATESAFRRARPRINIGLNMIGPEEKTPTSMGTPEQQKAEHDKLQAKLARRKTTLLD